MTEWAGKTQIGALSESEDGAILPSNRPAARVPGPAPKLYEDQKKTLKCAVCVRTGAAMCASAVLAMQGRADGSSPAAEEGAGQATSNDKRSVWARQPGVAAPPTQRLGLLVRVLFFLTDAFLTEVLRAWMGDRFRSASA